MALLLLVLRLGAAVAQQQAAYGSRGEGWYALPLLPPGGLAMTSDVFHSAIGAGGSAQGCGQLDVLAAAAGAFGLPSDAQDVTLALVMDTPSWPPGTGALTSVISAAGLALLWDVERSERPSSCSACLHHAHCVWACAATTRPGVWLVVHRGGA